MAEQLEELRKGPNFESEGSSSPALDYPELPPLPGGNSPDDDGEPKCYVLGWLEASISQRLMQVAGYRAVPERDPTFQQSYARSLRYMSKTSGYFHTWTSFGVEDRDEETGPLLDLINRPEEYAGLPVLAICCSVESAYNRRPSKAQFDWFKQVLGKEPRWYLIDLSFYTWAYDVWGIEPCCLVVGGFSYLPPQIG